MKIDPYYQRQKCSPMTLVSGNIRRMQQGEDILYNASSPVYCLPSVTRPLAE